MTRCARSKRRAFASTASVDTTRRSAFSLAVFLGVAEAVVGYATINEVDLIAITTELCCGGNRNLTDTAEYIIRNAPCPVLCMRKPRKSKR